MHSCTSPSSSSTFVSSSELHINAVTVHACEFFLTLTPLQSVIRAEASRLEPLAFLLDELVDPFRERAAQVTHLIVGVDMVLAILQGLHKEVAVAFDVVVVLDERVCLEILPDPRRHRLVQEDVRNIRWLPLGVVAREGAKAVLADSPFVCIICLAGVIFSLCLEIRAPNRNAVSTQSQFDLTCRRNTFEQSQRSLNAVSMRFEWQAPHCQAI